MNFFDCLIHPDRDENPERGRVTHAANLLEIGEFQLLQLAFFAWHGRDMRDAEADEIFDRFMLHSQVPVWARNYAIAIIDLDAAGRLDNADPHYHRYDVDFNGGSRPVNRRGFYVAAVAVAIAIGGSLALAGIVADCAGYDYPPCFSNSGDLHPASRD